MGISSIFKRTKPSSSGPQESVVESAAKDGDRPRHIKRRPTTSDGSPDERKQNQHVPSSANNPASRKHGKASAAVVGHPGKARASRVVSESHAYKAGRKYVHPAGIESASEIDDLPTPEKSIDESYGAYYARDSKKNQPSKPAGGQQKRQVESSLFGSHRLTTPPLDTRTPQPKELDPF
ncbi:hypothetical protein LPJ56_004047, partial [Coemansia sp. RSA 2599]